MPVDQVSSLALRSARSQARRDVMSGRRTVADALADPSCARLHVLDVLAWQRYWGMERSEAFLRVTKICSPWATAGQLTDRQRALFARALRTRGIAA